MSMFWILLLKVPRPTNLFDGSIKNLFWNMISQNRVRYGLLLIFHDFLWYFFFQRNGIYYFYCKQNISVHKIWSRLMYNMIIYFKKENWNENANLYKKCTFFNFNRSRFKKMILIKFILKVLKANCS